MLRTVASRSFGVLRRQYCAPPAREPGPVGLSAGEDPRATLSELYTKTLEAVSDLPEKAAYRINVEKTTRYRLGVVSGTDDISEIEKTLGVGFVEEIIEQARDELELVPHMAQWEPWKTEDGKPPVKIELID